MDARYRLSEVNSYLAKSHYTRDDQKVMAGFINSFLLNNNDLRRQIIRQYWKILAT